MAIDHMDISLQNAAPHPVMSDPMCAGPCPQFLPERRGNKLVQSLPPSRQSCPACRPRMEISLRSHPQNQLDPRKADDCLWDASLAGDVKRVPNSRNVAQCFRKVVPKLCLDIRSDTALLSTLPSRKIAAATASAPFNSSGWCESPLRSGLLVLRTVPSLDKRKPIGADPHRGNVSVTVIRWALARCCPLPKTPPHNSAGVETEVLLELFHIGRAAQDGIGQGNGEDGIIG